jgi:hypothetical protein
MEEINVWYDKQSCPEYVPKDWISLINENFCLVSFRISGVTRYIMSPVSEVSELRMTIRDLYNRGVCDGIKEELTDEE